MCFISKRLTSLLIFKQKHIQQEHINAAIWKDAEVVGVLSYLVACFEIQQNCCKDVDKSKKDIVRWSKSQLIPVLMKIKVHSRFSI